MERKAKLVDNLPTSDEQAERNKNMNPCCFVNESCFRSSYCEDHEDEKKSSQHFANAVPDQGEETYTFRVGSNLTLEEYFSQGDPDYSADKLWDDISC